MFKSIVLLYATYELGLPIWCKVLMLICLVFDLIKLGIKIYKQVISKIFSKTKSPFYTSDEINNLKHIR